MNHLWTLSTSFLLACALPAAADGLLRPSTEGYPKDFLRNRMTRVTVNIHGLVAETAVYQEFVNEWDNATDAVYSFPLPPEARANLFLYWRNDTTFKAVLKVRQQVPGPGTGEGGVAALVNKYIGRNGLRIELKDIAPGTIQRVELHYVSRCDYYRGESAYRFPLATGDFVTYPLEHLQFNFDVQTNSDISSYDIPTHPSFRTLQAEPRRVRLEMSAPKSYIDRDLEFRFTTDNTELGVDFYSVANDTMDGHYALFVRPPAEADLGEVLPKRVIFLLGNSSRMFGYKLEQSLTAISQSIDLLGAGDYFNVMVFNNSVQSWQGQLVPASAQNRLDAKRYLSTITTQFGSRMDLGLKTSLSQLRDDSLSNAILLFTDGRSPIDPREIASLNTYRAGIFSIGIGDDLDRARLEMTSALNYGFVTYFRETDNLTAGMLQVFGQINQPLLKDVAVEFGRAHVYDMLPETIPAAFAASYFFTTGRYKNPGSSALAIAGNSVSGVTAYDFQLAFSDQTAPNKFAESIWAKEVIDALEREVEVYGENEALKDSLITLSLRYNIRCRYTAYIADYTTVYTYVDEQRNKSSELPSSYLLGCYPNPFNPTTVIRFYLSAYSAVATVKLIKIYNALGQLVAVFDISDRQPGWHSLHLDGRDYLGRVLPSGVYFVRLQVDSEVSTMRITLMR